MRTSTIIVLICLGVVAFAAETNTEAAARAGDAVDAALQVLYDLRQANVDAQDAADEQNRTQQAACDSEISDLQSIADSNKASGDAATGHRKYLENEIQETHEYLDWIINEELTSTTDKRNSPTKDVTPTPSSSDPSRNTLMPSPPSNSSDKTSSPLLKNHPTVEKNSSKSKMLPRNSLPTNTCSMKTPSRNSTNSLLKLITLILNSSKPIAT